MKIVYLMFDERPCNTLIVQRIARSVPDLQLVMPPEHLLGLKKRPADTKGLWEWLNEAVGTSDALILSVDMLLYGGLIPSRLHHIDKEQSDLFIEKLRSFHKTYPTLPIFAANVVMRTPKYSSNDEEPDYYQEFGRELFLRASLMDKRTRDKLSEDEVKLLDSIESKLPKSYIEDYESRRAFNLTINKRMLDLVHEGVLTFLSIPQDDSAEYGYTAIDQKVIVAKREQLRLYKKVQMYPGSDEVGATLLARVYNELTGVCPKIYPLWSSTLGPQLIPMYEDRPFGESMKAHIFAAGCQLADNPESADLILAYNTPGRVMQESWEQFEKDITYTSFRNMLTFVDQIKKYIQSGKKVIVADSAYANGGDLELITLLDEEGILDQLLSYKGWNTNCNTLGTTIAQGVVGLREQTDIIRENLLYHLLDDYFYQSEVRMEMVADFLPKYDLNYFDLKDKEDLVNLERNKRLIRRYKEVVRHSFKEVELQKIDSFAPWNRMFECGLEMKLGPVQTKENK
ncbi:hypothetical protein AF332_19165 [Sporosarcina globispora]|uniref:DUF4127 domain-containing protein n=1 Tax=Sporosarcina globispora TaxID=1459 RepID=A0A0M0GG15_SPOGL|nr:hypothetical protein AF332_19165 [Sporosarcina globispora]